MGANVTGVCSTRNVDLVRSIGADNGDRLHARGLYSVRPRYDAIFDLVGNHSLSDIRRALEPRGVLVPCGGGGPDRSSFEIACGQCSVTAAAGPFISQRIAGLLAKINAEDLEHIAALVEAGM